MILRVADLRQYAYCPRVVYFTYVQPLDRQPTYKMKEGNSAESKTIPTERRRTLARYELPQGVRTFGVSLSSPRIGLSGKLDLLIEAEGRYYPVEFKTTRPSVFPNMRCQLAGYALLVEERSGTPVESGFIQFLPSGRTFPVDLPSTLKAETRGLVETMRRMIEREEMPEPTPRQQRCADCEYRNFCGDVS
ncbi:MAG: CRISPR-associated protein Cas4 [Nitrospirae bacterium]|nr:CRISPR-associated protein Cas4 [Nitrospirota bacterium]